MAGPGVYPDEDVYSAVAVGLRRRGFDVLTTVEAARQSCSDADQLRFAAMEGRVIVTFNRGHYARLHAESLAGGQRHAGIVVARQAGIGPIVKALARLLGGTDPAAFADRFVWLAIE